MTQLADTMRNASQKQFATFYVDEQLVGLDIDNVREINKVLDLSRVAKAPACVRGIANLRGDVITVIDLRTVLGMQQAPITAETANVVVTSEGETIGLIVDRVADILSIPNGDMLPPTSNIKGIAERVVHGVVPLKDELLVILDQEEILRRL